MLQVVTIGQLRLLARGEQREFKGKSGSGFFKRR
jgi:hypothetical protein